jgi:hypothetical protein
MEEFVRVSFDGSNIDPERESGDVIFGSRVSGKYEWHSRQYLQNDHAGWWIRTTGDQQELHPENCIGNGHEPIGQNP